MDEYQEKISNLCFSFYSRHGVGDQYNKWIVSPTSVLVLNMHVLTSFFLSCSEEKAESIAEYKDELEQTKTMVAKLRQEASFFFLFLFLFEYKTRFYEKDGYGSILFSPPFFFLID